MNKTSFALKVAIPFALFSLQTSAVQAADSVVLTDSGLELTVTANRRIRTIADTLAPVSVITRERIEKLQARDIVDVLRLETGVDIARNGGAGNTTSVFLRGATSKQSLILIDGVRVSSASTGDFNFSGLPLELVERIEIIRGPRASLYGSDAIGGVIQIFTRKKSGSHGSMQFGKYGTTGFNLGVSENKEKTNFAFNVSSKDSTGFSATNERAGEYSFNDDLDGYSKKSINISGSHQITDSSKLGLSLLHSNNDADYDQGESKLEIQTISTYLESKISDKWTQKLSLNKAKNNSTSIGDFGTYTFDTERREANWQNDLNLSNDTDFTVGANYRKTKGDTEAFKGTISNKAIYGNLIHRLGKTNLDYSLRYDDHSQAGSDVNNQFTAGYSISPFITTYASYGTAFRAPTINDLYYPGYFGTYAGNADLQPEKSKSYEVGLKASLGTNKQFTANIFRTNIEDAISASGPDNSLINIDKTLMKGIELSLNGRENKLDWGLGATIQRAVNDETKERLARRPNNKFTAHLNLNLTPKTKAGIDALLVSSRVDGGEVLPSYNLINVSLNHKLSNKVNLGLRVENLTDEIYETAYGYNTPRRGAFLTLSYND